MRHTIFRSVALMAALLMGGIALMGCVQGSTGVVKADMNNLKHDSYQSKKDMAALKQELGALKQEMAQLRDTAREIPKEDSLTALRASQTALYTQLSDAIREMQTLSNKSDEDKYSVQKRLRQMEADLDVLKSNKSSDGEIKKLNQRLSKLEIEIKSLKADASAAASTATSTPAITSPTASSTPATTSDSATPKQMYDAAYKEIKNKNTIKARQMMQALLKKYPGDALAGNAQFWIGETLYDEKKYDESILAYEEVIRKFPDSRKVPDSLLKQAYAFIKLGETSAARGLLKVVIDKYPKSKTADHARKKLKSIN